MTNSITGRLVFMFAACGALVFLVGAVLLHSSLKDQLDRQMRDEMALRATLLETTMLKAKTEEHWSAWVAPKLDALVAASNEVALWVESDRSSFRFAAPPAELAGRVGQPDGFATLQIGRREILTFARSIPADGERPGLRFVVARDDEPWARTLLCFRDALVATGGAGLALVALLGMCIARVGLAPLARLSAQAQGLRPNQTARRLGFVPLPRELEQLTDSFNGALERQERACQRLEAFNANVAHELRTPLMNLIGQTQVTLMRSRDAATLEENLRSNLEEMERLRAIVNDMLFLARADQGVRAAATAAVSLAAEVRRVAEFLEPLLEESSHVVRIEGDAKVQVDVALVRRAVSNLLLNAIHHGEPGRGIVVQVASEGGVPSVAVSNHGQEVDEDHLARVFDRFYRGDPARESDSGNHGLGLSIVKAIATMHQGSVFARSRSGRNTFGFTLAMAA